MPERPGWGSSEWTGFTWLAIVSVIGLILGISIDSNYVSLGALLVLCAATGKFWAQSNPNL